MRKFLIVLMAVAMASFLFVGCGVTPPVNTAPVITPIPDATITAGDTFTYAVVATDPDVEDVLTYSLTVAPEDMLIDADSGVITWAIVNEGTFGVIVMVTDEGGLTDFEGFTITVSAVEPEPEPNLPPEIISSAITSGKVGVAYTYDVNATDPEGDILTYSLTEKPLGMSVVTTTGIISWTPTDVGVFAVGVKVSDPDGLSDIQSFSITVAKADEEEPEPEPELQLIGIEVDPKTMDLIVGGSDTIDSVTATYEIRGYEVILDSGDCLFLSSDTDVATISDGEVTAVGEGTADILVSYEGKFATLEVTVTYLPMEIIADLPSTFTVGIPEGFIIEIVANSDAGKKVQPYLLLPEEVTLHWWCEEGGLGWIKLTGGTDDPIAISTFPPYELEDVIDVYKAVVNTVGTYSATMVFKTYPGGVTLCSKVITAKVIPVIPPVDGMID